jgi:putative heme transporter
MLVALGAKGLSVALAMLAITLLANNTLQNLLEPVAFGRTLRLHPLVVLLVTTAGTLLFGVLGATLAAPVTAVSLRTIGLLGDAGVFGVAVTPAAAAEVSSSQDGREASAGPAFPD